MGDSRVPQKRQIFILNGLNDFINEYIADYKDKEKINFDATLGLLGEMGSPTDIVLTMDVSESHGIISESESLAETGEPVICKNCYYSNLNDARFCENCGKKLIGLDKTKIRLDKTSKIRYNKALSYFQHRFYLGFSLTFFSGLLFVYLSIGGELWCVIPAFTIIGVSTGSFISNFLGEKKPKDIPYLELLTAKIMLDGYIREKLRGVNKNICTFLGVSLLIWVVASVIANTTRVSTDWTVPPLNEFLLVFYIVSAFCLSFNGFFLMYYYDWDNLTKFIQKNKG